MSEPSTPPEVSKLGLDMPLFDPSAPPAPADLGSGDCGTSLSLAWIGSAMLIAVKIVADKDDDVGRAEWLEQL